MNKQWKAGTILLLLLFLYFFGQFFMTTYQIQHSVNQIKYVAPVPENRKHITVISQELDNPYWKTVEKGAKEAAAKYGMQMEYIGPIRINPDEQLALMDKAIASQSDGLIVQGSKEKAFLSLMKKAEDHHIPVIAVDTDTPANSKISYVGTDNFASGQALGRAIATGIKGRGEVGIILGSATAENHQLRLKGILSVLKEHPEIKQVSVQTSNISRIQSARQAEKMILKYPNIKAIAGTSALDGVGILQAVKNLNRQDIQIYGFDELEETKKAIKKGEIRASIAQRPYRMGFESIKLLADYYQKKHVPKEHFTSFSKIQKNPLERN